VCMQIDCDFAWKVSAMTYLRACMRVSVRVSACASVCVYVRVNRPRNTLTHSRPLALLRWTSHVTFVNESHA